MEERILPAFLPAFLGPDASVEDGKRPGSAGPTPARSGSPAERANDRRQTFPQPPPACSPANSTDSLKAQTEVAPDIEEHHEIFSRGREQPTCRLYVESLSSAETYRVRHVGRSTGCDSVRNSPERVQQRPGTPVLRYDGARSSRVEEAGMLFVVLAIAVGILVFGVGYFNR